MSLSRTLAVLVYIAHHLWVGAAMLASLTWLVDHFNLVWISPQIVSFATRWMASSMVVMIIGPVLCWDGTSHYHCAPLYLRRAIQVASGDKVGGLFTPLFSHILPWSDVHIALALNLFLLGVWLRLLLIEH
jgi:hypothetical protein